MTLGRKTTIRQYGRMHALRVDVQALKAGSIIFRHVHDDRLCCYAGSIRFLRRIKLSI